MKKDKKSFDKTPKNLKNKEKEIIISIEQEEVAKALTKKDLINFLHENFNITNNVISKKKEDHSPSLKESKAIVSLVHFHNFNY